MRERRRSVALIGPIVRCGFALRPIPRPRRAYRDRYNFRSSQCRFRPGRFDPTHFLESDMRRQEKAAGRPQK
jgi:hypothetical protein